MIDIYYGEKDFHENAHFKSWGQNMEPIQTTQTLYKFLKSLISRKRPRLKRHAAVRQILLRYEPLPEIARVATLSICMSTDTLIRSDFYILTIILQDTHILFWSRLQHWKRSAWKKTFGKKIPDALGMQTGTLNQKSCSFQSEMGNSLRNWQK